MLLHRDRRNVLKKYIAIIMSCMLLLGAFAGTAATVTAKEKTKEVEILFTHDMHSHLEKFPKIKTVINEKNSKGGDAFVLDGGDFSMGTPFQTIYMDEAAELRSMGFVGYDVTTFGNHEFDYRSAGLKKMLDTAKASGERLPQLVCANIDFDSTINDPDLAKDGKKLKKSMEDFGVKPYTVVEKNGCKMAVFGIFGNESASYAPESGTLFKDPVETAQSVVDQIKKDEKVDLIVCVSHSGTNPSDPDKSEDEILAQKVDGIDLIVSGHSHSYMNEPIKHGDTYVVSCGQYNDNIGSICLELKDGKVNLKSYELIPLDGSVKDDEATFAKINEFKGLVNQHYFSKYGYSWDQVIAENNVDFTPIDVFGTVQGEDTLGNFIADSYIYGIKQAEGDDYEPVTLSVAPSGVVRGSFAKGDVTVADAFNVLSLGIGKDRIPGYPLVSVYLTGKEIKLAAEIDISVSDIMQPARLYCTGISYKYNPNRMILNRAYDVKLMDENGKLSKIEDDKLYRVCADLYSAQMLGTVNSISKGLLSVVPKDKDGNEVTDFEDQIIYDKNGNELKEWYALATYVDSFEDNQIPDKYSQLEGRKVLEDDKSIGAFFKNPNKYFWIVIGVLAAVVAIVVLIILLIVKLVKKSKRKKAEAKRKM